MAGATVSEGGEVDETASERAWGLLAGPGGPRENLTFTLSELRSLRKVSSRET